MHTQYQQPSLTTHYNFFIFFLPANLDSDLINMQWKNFMNVTKIMAWPVIRYFCKARRNYEERTCTLREEIERAWSPKHVDKKKIIFQKLYS